MVITDIKLREAFRTDIRPSMETERMLLERLNAVAVNTGSRSVKAGTEGSDRRTGGSGRGIVTGILAIAAVAVLAVLLIKVIPSLRSPLADRPGPETDWEPAVETQPTKEMESQPTKEMEVENGQEEEGTYLKVPVRPEELRWGMSEEEVIEVLGEPDKTNLYPNAIVLTYRNMETSLGMSSEVRLGFDPVGARFSEKKTIPLGLYSIAAEYSGMTEEDVSKRLAALYGEYDGTRESGLSLDSIPSGIQYTLYEWDSWKMGALPGMKKRVTEVQEAMFAYMDSNGMSMGSEETVSDEEMALEIRLAMNSAEPGAEPGPLDEPETPDEPAATVIFNAERYLFSVQPEKEWVCENESFRFVVPEIWQERGVSIEEDEREVIVKYRGAELFRIFAGSPEEIDERMAEVIDDWSVPLGNGDHVAYWGFEYARKLISEVYTEGVITVERQDGIPADFTSHADLEAILYMVTGEQVDTKRLAKQSENEKAKDYYIEVLNMATYFYGLYVTPNLTVYTEEYKNNNFKEYDPNALKSSYLKEFLKAEPWQPASLPDRMEDYQIPEDVLHELTDEELFLTLLDYPFYGGIEVPAGTEHINQYWGDTLAQRYNGFRELTERENRSSFLSMANRCHDYVVREYGWAAPRELLSILESIILYLDENLDEGSTIW